MSATSIGRIIAPYFALAAACGAALVFGVAQLRRESPVEAGAATAALLAAPPASGGTVALATPQAKGHAAEGQAAAAPLDVRPGAPDTDQSAPVFDIARIGRTGEAVIAGRAAPGATVELLRNGEPFDRAVADESGQFVTVPPPLPRGDYELTLRSTQPDGKQVTSKQSVAVALGDVEPTAGADQSRSAVLQSPSPTADLLSDGNAPTAAIGPKAAKTVVSRGDSLWRISRASYGSGLRYAIIYNANRGQVRDPNRIYPGQVFVIPMKAR